MSGSPFAGRRPWPPVITTGSLSGWIMARDVCLTTLMWFFFLLLLAGEIERVVIPWLDRFGIPINVKGIGYADLADDWRYFIYALAPFLGIALLLVIVLVSFTIGTLNRRSRARRGPLPPPLALGVEARHAALATVGGHAGPATLARREELARLEEVDGVAILAALSRLDQAALADARALRVTQVHLTEEGQYQILPDDDAKSLAGGA